MPAFCAPRTGKSGRGRIPAVARPYGQTAFRSTARTGSGRVGTSGARLRIAELLHQLARLGLDLLDLLRREVAPPAADRLGVHPAERPGEQHGIGPDVDRDRLGGPLRVGGKSLVADLDGARRSRARRRHVAAPRPARAPRFARLVELGAPLLLDPEARMVTVRLADVVLPRPAGPQPTLLDKRGRDVPRVSDHVHD